ncbi:unnamed protein product [Orchesella dallaii]|uniref:Uncharacterized protein n=1 Tax=Orchesella dallaii TaxID=48710 RepID=A0ABP1R953_9HEXA
MWHSLIFSTIIVLVYSRLHIVQGIEDKSTKKFSVSSSLQDFSSAQQQPLINSRVPPFQPKANEETNFYLPIPYNYNPQIPQIEQDHSTNPDGGSRQSRTLWHLFDTRLHRPRQYQRTSNYRNRNGWTSYRNNDNNNRNPIIDLTNHFIGKAIALKRLPFQVMQEVFHQPLGQNYRTYGSCQYGPCRSVKHAIDSFFKAGFLGR